MVKQDGKVLCDVCRTESTMTIFQSLKMSGMLHDFCSHHCMQVRQAQIAQEARSSAVVGEQHPVVGGRYRHYKGGEYVVEGFCRYELNGEVGVLYSPCEAGHGLPWIRPLRGDGGWLTPVAPSVSRFEKIVSSGESDAVAEKL